MNLEMYLLRILAKNVHSMILERTLEQNIAIHVAFCESSRIYEQSFTAK